MIYTIAHLFRKTALSRSEFSEYYETRHTHLARRVLPEFSYYRRNHVLESTDDAVCPDSFSEFAYDDKSKLLETMSILSDGRGQELMGDELQFMNKSRNQVYPVLPRGEPKNVPFAYKVIVVIRGASSGVESWRAAWRVIDPTLQHTMIYSEIGSATDQQLHWLLGWSPQLPVLPQLQEQLIARSVPVLWCSRVDECIGYPH